MRALYTVLLLGAFVVACDGGGGGTGPGNRPPTNPQEGPPAGWAEGNAEVPPEGQAEDVSSPTRVIGTGTPESCTGEVVSAVAEGGVITFDCGPDPVTIVLTETAKVFNDPGASWSSTAATRSP